MIIVARRNRVRQLPADVLNVLILKKMVLINVPEPVAAAFRLGEGLGGPSWRLEQNDRGIHVSVRWTASVRKKNEDPSAANRATLEQRKPNSRQRRSKRRLENFLARKKAAVGLPGVKAERQSGRSTVELEDRFSQNCQSTETLDSRTYASVVAKNANPILNVSSLSSPKVARSQQGLSDAMMLNCQETGSCMSETEHRNSSLSALAAEERPRPRNQSSSKKNAYAFKYNIGQRLRLSGTKTSVMVVERHLPGSSHHDPSLVNLEGKVSTCTIQPCDSVCPEYFVKTSKNEFFKVSEGRLCY